MHNIPVREGMRFTILAGVSYTVVTWALVMAFPHIFIHIFNSDPELLEAGAPAFRIYFVAFFAQAFQQTSQAISVALNRSRSAVFFSLFRKAFIVAQLTVLLPALGLGVNGVFLAEPISNVLGGVTCFLALILLVYIPMGRMADGA